MPLLLAEALTGSPAAKMLRVRTEPEVNAFTPNGVSILPETVERYRT